MGDPPSRQGELLSDKYLLKHRLGVGGMGEVYLAENQLIQRIVAIKLLLPDQTADPQVVDRFLQEARAANIVRHPNVVDVLDIGQDAAGTPYIVQEYLEGQDLEAVLSELRGRLALESALELLLPIVEAIGFAHANGVVHRDLKPSNVFLARVGSKRVPKVLDFGIAKVTRASQSRRVTATGVAMGTPAYMAPEVIREGARHADARSDVWSLGVMLYEVLSGTLPFDAPTLAGLFAAICSDQPKPLSETAPGLPGSIVRVIDKCLAKNPADRYPNASQAAKDLAAILDACRSKHRGHTAADVGRLVEEAAARVTLRARTARPDAPTQQAAGDPAAKPATDSNGIPVVPDLVIDPGPARQAPASSSNDQPPPKITIDRMAALRFAKPAPSAARPAAPEPVAKPSRAHPARQDGPLPQGGPKPLLVLLLVPSCGALAAAFGAETPITHARNWPQYATVALGAGALVIAVLGLLLLRHLKLCACSTLGSVLTASGVLGYAGMLGAAALQSAGAGLPNLFAVIAPASLLCAGLGVITAASGRARDAWRADRSWLLATLFALVAIAGATLAGYSGWVMFRLY